MIDPVSIGVAFAAAQSIVSNVKSAIGTGKDVYGIVKDIGKFMNINSDINKANIDLKLDLLNKSDEELQAQALQTAWMANQMAEYRRQLKDLLYWSGNAKIWDDMEREHVRLIKQKRELEKARDEAARLHKEKVAEAILTGVVTFVLVGLSGFGCYIAFTIYIR